MVRKEGNFNGENAVEDGMINGQVEILDLPKVVPGGSW